MTPARTITATHKGIKILYEGSTRMTFINYPESLLTKKNCSDDNQPHYQRVEMNPIQSSMYRRLLYGIGAYTAEEVSSMDYATRNAIREDHEKAEVVLRKLKYEHVYGAIDRLFNAIFKEERCGFELDADLVGTPSLRQLKIPTREIVDQFIGHGLLPENFYSINFKTMQL